MNPLFEVARTKHSDAKSIEEALQIGSKSTGEHPAVIRQRLAELETEPEKEAFLRGFSGTKEEEALGHAFRGDATNKVMGSPEKEDAVRAVTDPEKFKTLQEKLDIRNRQYQSFFNAKLGSQTDRYGQMQQDISESAIESAHSFLEIARHDGVLKAIGKVGASKLSGFLRWFDQAKRAHIAKMLLSKDPAVQEAALKAMEGQLSAVRAMREMGETGTSQVGGLVTATGAPIVRPLIDPQKPEF
jgi:hypothetical protein